MLSRWASWILVPLFALALLASGCLVVASATGAIGETPTTLDPAPYIAAPPNALPPNPGLARIDPNRMVNAEAIKQGLEALGRSGVGNISFCVTDLQGRPVDAEFGDSGRTPASSWKILTALGVLSAYGSAHRFSTAVYPSDSGVVLVGGGDPYLTNAGAFNLGQARLEDLADQTVAALTAAGRTSVNLGYDDSLFAGPQWNSAWPPEEEPFVSPISALSVDPKGAWTSDTSLAAARLFADRLADQGIAVSKIAVERADKTKNPLAEVESLPLGVIVRRVLELSDNFASEVLFRHISVAAGGDGSFVGGRTALRAYLQEQGLWSDQMVVSDGSGLSLYNQVPACQLAAAVRLAFGDPALDDVLVGLPIAGVSGTLADRFDDPNEAAGRGVVRAKTGSQDYVRTLTGYAQTSSGAVVVFSLMLNQLANYNAGVDWIDEAAAVLASA